MIIEFWLSGAIPSKKNNRKIVKYGSKTALIGSDRYRAWAKNAHYQIKAACCHQLIEPTTLVSLYIVMPDNRRRDLTNAAEGVMDALVDAGVLRDDCHQVVGSLFLQCVGVDKNNPGVRIKIDF